MLKADSSIQSLRAHNYSRYLSILFAPAVERDALAALYNFQHEIIHIARQVKEPLLGEMRLNYWREAVSNAARGAGETAENISASAESARPPMIRELSAAMQRHNLPAAPFLSLCGAVTFDLYQEPRQDRASFETYCADIYGAIVEQVCFILDRAGIENLSIEGRDQFQQACFHGGIAEGIVMLIHHLPHSIRQKKQPVPQDILNSLGIDKAQFFEIGKYRESEEERDIANRLIFALCSYFRQHYEIFRGAEKSLPNSLRPAFLPLAVLPVFLKRIEKKPESLFTENIRISHLTQQRRIFCAALFNRF